MADRPLLPQALVPQALSPYLTREEVGRLAASCHGRNRIRDELLILTLFQTGLRISEALRLTPRHIGTHAGGAALYVLGKGDKARLVACPYHLAHRLKSFAFDRKLGLDDRIFKINRRRAWQIIKAISERAGIAKRVYPHLFRHSGAIERLRQTGNPRGLGPGSGISVLSGIFFGHCTICPWIR
jgi:integrase/recombinase XerD